MLEVVIHSDARDFLAASGAFLEARESENSLPLGIAHALARDPARYGAEPSCLLRVLLDGDPVAAAVMTPPRRIILARMSHDVRQVAQRLIAGLEEASIRPPGVVAPSAEARAFAETWCARRGLSSVVHTRLRVHEARRVERLSVAPGRLRAAGPEDRDLLLDWMTVFSEAVGEPADDRTVRDTVDRGLAASELFLWDRDGPVSVARQTRRTPHGVSIGAVYTPPERRGRGYATSCVHALTRRLLAEGREFCSLYTDLANPTSNSIYRKIGYRPVGDSLAIDFTPP